MQQVNSDLIFLFMVGTKMLRKLLASSNPDVSAGIFTTPDCPTKLKENANIYLLSELKRKLQIS